MDIDYSVEITQDNSLVGVGEIVGLVLAGIVLVAMLGTLIAAGLPLAVAMIGVGVGLAAAMALTAFYEMNSMTPALALMLGLAVGIDYALFIVNRHRSQLLQGMDLKSIARAVGTSGSAVLFAGTTVVIALVALVLSGIPLLAQMGLVAAGTVAVAVLVALTFSPRPPSHHGHAGRLASWMASGRIHHPGRGLDPRRHRGPARGGARRLVCPAHHPPTLADRPRCGRPRRHHRLPGARPPSRTPRRRQRGRPTRRPTGRMPRPRRPSGPA